ncbi:hypothetical protein O1D97_09085 [Marinomonas sp. 15G1-11]|uniref:Uncharacterized protein n=1 Tax=Marinomonas phaeophyticola TaxID=3004091 RepID=A0ABT4JU79_9GAMM|nr:hypothetical protein [Marinomonas sp. 15G1-11]MCZ2721801.1 hypothetical protein [Marinomonas sp. 15G1-11]
MIKKLPLKHILLLVVITLALFLIATMLPDGSNKPSKTISLEANLQIIDMDELDNSITFITLPTKTTASKLGGNLQTAVLPTLNNNELISADLPIPDNLQKKK